MLLSLEAAALLLRPVLKAVGTTKAFKPTDFKVLVVPSPLGVPFEEYCCICPPRPGKQEY